MRDKSSRLVYSTETGKTCPDCERPVAQCQCRSPAPPPGDGIVRVSLSTKGRKGAGVTEIRGIPESEERLRALCKLLKKKCGTGGSVKAHVIEIQGDKRDQVVTLLQAEGYQVKRAGG